MEATINSRKFSLLEKYKENQSAYIMMHRPGNFSIKFTLKEIVELSKLIGEDTE